MPLRDRYDNVRTTHSAEALTYYERGVDRFLAAQPGAVADLQQAVSIDPGFAVAHADLARVHRVLAQPHAAQTALAAAERCLDGLPAAEQRHVRIVAHLLVGDGAAAYDLTLEHLRTQPRDVMAIAPSCGVFGLIGFSGRAGREAENLAFMARLQPHYPNDWWFDSQYAFALIETGQLAQAQPLLERALAANPDNANAVHHRAHLHYELGESNAGLAALEAWRSRYHPQALLHCHLTWHSALWLLAAGDESRLWQLLQRYVLPQEAGGEPGEAPPINLFTDLVAILLRAELAGLPRSAHLWQTASDYGRAQFPDRGVPFVDMHAAVAHAMAGNDLALQKLSAPVTEPLAADAQAQRLVAQLARAFAAFAAQRWKDSVTHLVPVIAEHERLGGSRAQRDLLTLTLIAALEHCGQRAEAGRWRQMRRPLSVMIGGYQAQGKSPSAPG